MEGRNRRGGRPLCSCDQRAKTVAVACRQAKARLFAAHAEEFENYMISALKFAKTSFSTLFFNKMKINLVLICN